VLVPIVLLTQVTPPIRGAAALQINREEHLRGLGRHPIRAETGALVLRDRDRVNGARALRGRYDVRRRTGPMPARYTRRRSVVSRPRMRQDRPLAAPVA
jgi:hypothetical protein